MIDPGVKSWLEDKNLPPEQSALVVQVTRMPEEKIRALRTVGERIGTMKKHVADRLSEVCSQYHLPADSVEVVGASDAIIRAKPEKLRQLLSEDGPFAKAEDLLVRPNVLMPGIGPV